MKNDEPHQEMHWFVNDHTLTTTMTTVGCCPRYAFLLMLMLFLRFDDAAATCGAVEIAKKKTDKNGRRRAVQVKKLGQVLT